MKQNTPIMSVFFCAVVVCSSCSEQRRAALPYPPVAGGVQRILNSAVNAETSLTQNDVPKNATREPVDATDTVPAAGDKNIVAQSAPLEGIPVQTAPRVPGQPVDVDLTQLSAVMVYGEVFNMLIEPERYEGKTVRMRGMFDVFEYSDGGEVQQVFACVILDATACCAQGLEFSLAGNHSYPQDYPDRFEMITVTGRFHHYEKNGFDTMGLMDSVLE
ncbi:MAG: hypothetical protein IJ191_03410 [Treponema sp.]|nr:hypothetical protein [Treponema sp.]